MNDLSTAFWILTTGGVAAALVVTALHTAKFLGRTRRYGLAKVEETDATRRRPIMPRRQSPEWRLCVVLTAWSTLASVFCAISLLEGVVGLSRLAVVLSGGTVLLLSAELFVLLYRPGIGLVERIGNANDDDEDAASPPERSLVGRVILFLVLFRPLTRRSDEAGVYRLDPRLQLADLTLLTAWRALAWVVILGVALAVFTVVVFGPQALHVVDSEVFKLVIVTSMIPTLLFVIANRGSFERPVASGYVPKQAARDLTELYLVPRSQQDRRSHTRGIEVDAMLRRASAWLMTGLASALCAALTLLAFDIAADFARLLGALATAGLAVLVLVFHHRLTLGLWEKVGVSQARRLGFVFVREHAHQLKNLLEPIEYGLVAVEEYLVGQPDSEEVAFAKERVTAAKRNVDRTRQWMRRLSERPKGYERNVRMWLAPEHEDWESLLSLVSDWIDHAAATNQSESRLLTRQIALTVGFRAIAPDGTWVYQSSPGAAQDPVVTLASVSSCLSALREQALACGAPIDRVRLQVDRETVIDLLTNLSRNAIQAAISGRDPQVRLLLVWNVQSRFPVSFVVHDRGPGIPAHARNRIFEPGLTSKPDGMGLGLFMLNEYASSISARVRFTTSSGHGGADSFSTFIFELPGSRVRITAGPD